PLAATSEPQRPAVMEKRAPASRSEGQLRATAPSFVGPLDYVKIPPRSMGPMYSRHNHDPGLTVCDNGDILVIWYTCEEEPGTEVGSAVSRLKLGATEWEAAAPFWDVPERNDHGPAIWNDGRGTLFHFVGNKQLPGSILRTSRDHGVTWSPARKFSASTQVNEAILRKRNGEVLVTLDGVAVTLVEASADNGETWVSYSDPTARPTLVPGEKGPAIAGIHAGLVELKDGRLLAFGRFDQAPNQKAFSHTLPRSVSTDGGRTWHYSVSVFPEISSTQRLTLKRLKEGPLLLCSFTDIPVLKNIEGLTSGVKPMKDRQGLRFPDGRGGEVKGVGLFAALSFDDGETWPVRRLITPGGEARPQITIDGKTFDMSDTVAEPSGYLAMDQDPAGTIHLISSRNYYAFNLAWLLEKSPASAKGAAKAGASPR
ncbi:MAG: sialidase family protein, partial [Verrucomicrobiota bacterium]